MIATQYFSYQQFGRQRFTVDSPNVQETMEYLLKRWGGMNLGARVNNRPMRHRTAISTHASGAALDWRYANPGPGRLVLVNEVLPFLIGHSKERGYQLIVDYMGDRAWNASRSGDALKGWKAGNYSGGEWIHVEVHPDFHGLDEQIETTTGTKEFPPFRPEYQQWSMWPYSFIKPNLKLGSTGDPVRYLQGVLRKAKVYGGNLDGVFGPVTANAVRFYQSLEHLQVDGIVGGKTWAKIDARALAAL